MRVVCVRVCVGGVCVVCVYVCLCGVYVCVFFFFNIN